jgi:hypothetical protein
VAYFEKAFGQVFTDDLHDHMTPARWFKQLPPRKRKMSKSDKLDFLEFFGEKEFLEFFSENIPN